MAFGLIIIGDEILSGKREDKHFQRVREILAARCLRLAWVKYLGDDRARIRETLAQSLAGSDVVFSTGGIGATPDDHTRQAAAAALGVPLSIHPEAERLIKERLGELGLKANREMLRMGEFPEGVEIIPNPFNKIPGFSAGGHHFLPGFPEMAWPMIEWVLDTRYAHLFNGAPETERALLVKGLPEGLITPLLERIEVDFPGVRIFSLPRIRREKGVAYEIEAGVKGDAEQTAQALEALRQGLVALGGQISAPQSG